MTNGQRVEVIEQGPYPYQGEKGTITIVPGRDTYQHRDSVWVVFDNPHRQEHLCPQWMERRFLKVLG